MDGLRPAEIRKGTARFRRDGQGQGIDMSRNGAEALRTEPIRRAAALKSIDMLRLCWGIVMSSSGVVGRGCALAERCGDTSCEAVAEHRVDLQRQSREGRRDDVNWNGLDMK